MTKLLSHFHFFFFFHTPSVINTHASHINWHKLKQSTDQWASQLQLLRNLIINWHTINACAHMSCLLAAMCLPGCAFIHYILISMCEWVTLASECVHVCDDYKSAFPWGITLCEQHGRTNVNVDGQPACVSETIWRSVPLSPLILAFRFCRIPPEMVLKKHTDIQEKTLMSLFITNEYSTF